MPCNTSSNIKATAAYINNVLPYARLVIKISSSLSQNVGIGDVIRYDAIDNVYKKSVANNTVNAEVVGIVESINSDNSKNVVIYGSVYIDPNILIFEDSTGAGNGNDIFFLSSENSGKLQNIAPDTDGSIVKSIYQISPHGSYTGIFVNNIGYALGGVSNNFSIQQHTDVGSIYPIISIDDNSDVDTNYYHVLNYFEEESIHIEPDLYLNYYTKFERKFGFREKCIANNFIITGLSPEFYLYDQYEITSGDQEPNAKVYSTNNLENAIFLEKDGTSKNQDITESVTSGKKYWLQTGNQYLGSIDSSSGDEINNFAYLSTPLSFSQTEVTSITLPHIDPSVQTFLIATAATPSVSIQEINNNIKFKLALQMESSSNFNVQNNSTLETLRTTSLTVQDEDISQKLLNLENRLSYLETRVSI